MLVGWLIGSESLKSLLTSDSHRCVENISHSVSSLPPPACLRCVVSVQCGVALLCAAVWRTSKRYPTNSGSIALRLTSRHTQRASGVRSGSRCNAAMSSAGCLPPSPSLCARLCHLDHTRIGRVCVLGPPAETMQTDDGVRVRVNMRGVQQRREEWNEV